MVVLAAHATTLGDPLRRPSTPPVQATPVEVGIATTSRTTAQSGSSRAHSQSEAHPRCPFAATDSHTMSLPLGSPLPEWWSALHRDLHLSLRESTDSTSEEVAVESEGQLAGSPTIATRLGTAMSRRFRPASILTAAVAAAAARRRHDKWGRICSPELIRISSLQQPRRLPHTPRMQQPLRQNLLRR